MANSRTAGRSYNPRSASKVDISSNLFTDIVDTRQHALFYDLVTYGTIILRSMAFYNMGLRLLRHVQYAEKAGKRFMTVEHPERLDESLDDYAEEQVEQYGGLSRMVNRNDDTVNAVLVGGRAVFLDGKPTDLVGKQRTGRFLRAAHKAPAVTARESELASVS